MSRYSSWNHVGCYNEIITSLDKLELRSSSKLLVYYTGHGLGNDNLRLPSGQLLPTSRMIDMILDRCRSNAKICFIFDCCSLGSAKLPYQLVGGEFRRINGTFRKQEVMMVASSLHSQIAVANHEYSFFTKSLFDYLSSGNLSTELMAIRVQSKLNGCLNNLDIKQTLQVFGSRPFIPVMWTWLVRSVDISSDANNFLLLNTPTGSSKLEIL